MMLKILNDELKPIDATTEEWAKYFENATCHKRTLYKTVFPWGWLSTVFIGDGINLFETMLFYDGHPEDRQQHNTDTWQEAHAMHKSMEHCLDKTEEATP